MLKHTPSDKKQTEAKREFSFEKPLYNQDSYWGRFKMALALFNPLNSLVPNQKIQDYKQYLDDMRARERIEQEQGRQLKLTDEQVHVIKRAYAVTGASVHPDTGQIISWPLRLSSFIYMGVPLTVGLTMAPATAFNTFFWMWANQTYFAGINLANRNASNDMGYVNTFMGFTAAAGAGIAIALFSRGLFKRITPQSIMNNPGNKVLFNSATSFLGLAGAAYVNSVVSRYNELKNGIMLYDNKGQEIGASRIAAHRAITQTAITRMMIAFQMVVIPGVIISTLQKARMMPEGVILRSVAQLAIIFGVLSVGSPASLAMYDREGKISPKNVEKELQNYKMTNGKQPSYFYFNRGL